MLHTKGRGQLVDNKQDVDTIFSMYEGITPYDISTIASEYLA